MTGVFFDPAGDGSDVATLAGALETFRPEAFDASAIRRHAETFGPDSFRRNMFAAVDEFLGEATARGPAA